jgi:hypothetical protein
MGVNVCDTLMEQDGEIPHWFLVIDNYYFN